MKKFCKLTTPENKEFIFAIPENAQIDCRGFYVIGDKIIKANPEINFEYLSHDLLHRGLNSENDFYEHDGVKIKFPDYEVIHLRDPIAKKSDDWKKTADAWLFKIKNETFEYFTGSGCRKKDRPVKPKIIDLVYALVSDSAAMDQPFSDWCAGFGLDTDSRKALATYEECQENAKKLLKIVNVPLEKLREFYQDY